MYLDRELQVILSAPVPGAAEEIIIEHKPGARGEVLDWMSDQNLDAAVDPLPKRLISVVIDQQDIIPLLNHNAVTAAAVDNGIAIILLQMRRELFTAVETADAVSSQLNSE